MEEHAGLLKKRHPGTLSFSICIVVKLPEEADWHKFSLEQIKRAARDREEEEQKRTNKQGTGASRQKILMATEKSVPQL